MGSISVLPDSIHLNIQNPAHFASLRLTTFSLGGTYGTTNSKTETQESKAKRTSFDYLAVGVPIGKKLGIGFGLIPYSSLGYKIQRNTYEINTAVTPVDTTRADYTKYNGIGGVNKVFFGVGYQIAKGLNIGADVQYNFGTIETSNLRYQIEPLLQYGSRENNKSEVRGLNFDFGLAYQRKIGKKHSLFASMTYTPESELKLSNTRNIELVELLTSTAISIIERVEIPVENTTIKLPSKLSFGSGFGEARKWMIGGEVTFIKNSVLSNRFNDIGDDGTTSFENSTRYSLGGYFIPNYNSYSSYLKRVVYRAGLRYENTGLVIQKPGYPSKSINDFATSFGFGMPMTGIFSNINLGFEIGKRGTKYANLVEENYFNISVGLSLSDKWFVKRKYD